MRKNPTINVWLLLFVFSLIQTNSTHATLPEPETLIYGQVFNQYQNNNILVTDAKVNWTIRKKGSDHQQCYEGKVECVKCQEYDDTGVNCISCDTYAYLIKIPQQTGSVDNGDTIPLSPDNQQYDLISATVNDVPANMRLKSQYGNIKPGDKQGTFILAGQPRRSHYYEIDLELVLPVTDTDKDSLPDFWETQYNLDINDPSDALIDTDNDGWNNLKEFLNATNPTASNNVPSLLEKNILIFEGTKTLFQLNVADSDTPKDELHVKFISIPENINLIFHGNKTPFSHGHVIKQNEMISLAHLDNGNVILKSLTTNTSDNYLSILLIDNDHDPVMETISIDTYKPSATDGTDAILWADAFNHANENKDKPSKQLKDRSGNNNRGNYYVHSQADDSYVESNIQVVENESPVDNQTIRTNGYFELPYATPVFPSGNMTLLTVFKVQPSEADQIIASGAYFEVAVAGSKHALHPGELKVADESTTVYSNKRVDTDWVMATITRKDGHSFIDIDTMWTGGPFAYEETTELSNDPIMGGKNIWKWNFNQLAWVGNVSGVMDGFFAEMLVFERDMQYMEKWRIYAHLRGKWFGNVVCDHSQSTRDIEIMAVSGKRSEIIRQKRMDADQAWMAYRDAVFDDQNVIQALDTLETFLPENWQWTTIPPTVDEALQAIDSIEYDYKTDFVDEYGNDHNYILIGGMGNDTIVGGFENDIIIGGSGNNILKGCAGKDIFVVTDNDTVIDFNESDQDILDISHLLNDADNPLNHYIHFELVNDQETGEVHTALNINANGMGDNFDDARILLHNVSLRDRIDIARLWASGNIHAGVVKPKLEVSLAIIDDQATEIPENPASIDISFSNTAYPKDLTVPLVFSGTAKIGSDFNLSFPVWNSESKKYEPQIISQNIVPIQLKPGDQTLCIKIVPIADHQAEENETIFVSLLEKQDYYQLKRNTTPSITISDGLDQISITAVQPIAHEGNNEGASIRITRNGSLDISKEINLLIKGTADNGRDCHYIASELTFAPGETQSIIPVVAYRDKEKEEVEFLEIIVASGDYKVLGPSSIRVEIRENENMLKGDMDNNNQVDLKDAITALKICSNKAVSTLNLDASLHTNQIGLADVLFILGQIAR